MTSVWNMITLKDLEAREIDSTGSLGYLLGMQPILVQIPDTAYGPPNTTRAYS